MPYYGDGAPYYYGSPFANHSSLMTGAGRSYHNPIAARYSPHLSTISESPFVVLRRYSPAATTTTTTTLPRPRRIIDTADIDVSKPPRTLAQENRQQRHRLRRDRPTIKIRSQALKDNPALREYNEKHEKTVGELLVEKFLIKDKQHQDSDRKMKLYHQASLMSNKEPTMKERENDILAAIRRRVTRRMTRRRSSADVIPLDPEQIEREAALQAAQAEALDTLVAEEQAEIEIEVRRGTFAKRQAMRLPTEISEVSETEDEEIDAEERKNDKKHVTKKKKRRKSIEKSLPSKSEDEDEDDDIHIPESVIEEEEFEWDDREKCDDVRQIVPVNEEKEAKKDDLRTDKSYVNIDEKIVDAKIKSEVKTNDMKVDLKVKSDEKKDKVDRKVKELKKEDKVDTVKVKELKKEDKVDTLKVKETKGEDKADTEEVKEVKKEDEKSTDTDKKNLEEKSKEKKLNKGGVKEEEKLKIKDKKLRDLKDKTPKIEHNRLKRTTSAPQSQVEETDESTPRFKVEACNSVGDMSTLYVKAANSPSEAFKTIEQFRESIRLPAPRRGGLMGNTTIETEVVLPVRKPYVHDTSRNSVYLALKPSQIIRQSQVGADDRPSIIIDETRKESRGVTSNDSRPAKCSAVGGDRPKTEDDRIISEVTNALPISGEADKIEKSSNSELMRADDKSEAVVPLVDDIVKTSVVSGKEEFVSWWDETPEAESKEKSVERKVDAIAEKPQEKVTHTIKSETEAIEKVELEKKSEDLSEKIKDKSETVSVDEIVKNKTEVSLKVELAKTTANKASDLQDKSKLVVETADKSVKSVIIEIKDKPVIKTDDVQEKVTKSPSEKEVKPEEKLKATDAQKKVQPLPEVVSQVERKKKEVKSREDTLSSSKEELISSPVEKRTSPEKKLLNHELAKVKCELSRTDYHHLPNIPEEPKSTSPTEKKPLFASKPKTNDTSETKNNKSLFAKEEPPSFSVVPKKVDEPLIKPNLALVKTEKDEREKKFNAVAVMKIEKKILEEAESPSKILTSAIPETQIIEVTRFTPSTKKEEEKELQSSPEKKVGLPTKKKSEGTAAAAGTEIDFWSEIKAQESVKVSGTPSKVQSRVDLPIEENRQRPEKLKLDLSNIRAPTEDQEVLKTPLITDQEDLKTLILDQEDLKTPLIPDQEDQKTPLVPEQEDLQTPIVEHPAAPLAENLSEVPPQNLQSIEEQRSTVIYNGISAAVDKKDQEQKEEEELSGTVKKISKWTNRDNLANLNAADNEATPITSKEVSPRVSTASSTPKKKVVKKKKSTVTKKKSEKGESTKTSAKTKTPVKKVAASPQTSLLKAPMSAMGSPRNSPNQRPDDLKKLFYTTPAILLTATPRDLRKVRRAKVKRKKPPTRTPSLSSDSTGSTRSTATTSTEEGSNCEEDAEQKRLASTRSNDSGFDGSPRLSTPSQSSENQRNADGEHYQHSGRITPPATNLPRFKKYEVTDFNFLKVLGKGSFGKVLLAELRGTECVYAVKCLKKDVVLEDDDVECTLIERKVLTLATRHPYLCHLFCTFQTDSHLFFVMEYLNGGDLMFHIQKSGRFSEQRAKFYAAEIWSGLIFLHKKGIVYRDLKLDNVLLDFEGHIRIADFGMCKLQIFLDRTADTFCGTPDYMAPEIIKGLKYNQAVDWWSYGVLLYEMLTGQSPFSGCDEDELFWSICNERPFIPRYLSQSSTDILVCLLEKDSGKRIPGHEIACHPFFCTIAWDKLERRSLEPPFKPAVEHTLDTRYFDTAFTTERPRLTPVPEQILTSMDQEVFRGFSYTNPNATD